MVLDLNKKSSKLEHTTLLNLSRSTNHWKMESDHQSYWKSLAVPPPLLLPLPCLSVQLPACLPVQLAACLSVELAACLSIELAACLSVRFVHHPYRHLHFLKLCEYT